MDKIEDQSAFPFEERTTEGFPEKDHLGLNKREYFAGLAMQGMIGNPNIVKPDLNSNNLEEMYSDFSKVALMYADSILAELEKATS